MKTQTNRNRAIPPGPFLTLMPSWRPYRSIATNQNTHNLNGAGSASTGTTTYEYAQVVMKNQITKQHISAIAVQQSTTPQASEVSMKNHFFQGLHRTSFFAPVLAVTLLTSAFAAFGATLHVAKFGTDTSDCGSRAMPCLTIQYTIIQAHPGDLILIEPGAYSELVTVNKNLTLIGPRFGEAAIDGAHKGTVVTIASGVTAELALLTVQNGSATTTTLANVAGGIENDGTLTLFGVLVTDNDATVSFPLEPPLSGGIVNTGTLTVLFSSIVSNSASGGCDSAGGLVNFGGALTIEDSLIAANTESSSSSDACGGPSAIAGAGGLLNGGTAVVDTTSIWKNGVVNIGTFSLLRSTISDSSELAINNYASLTLVNSTISGNSGGAIVNDLNPFGEQMSILDMSNSTVANNSGGGVVFGPPFYSTIRNSILAGNGTSDCTGEFMSGDYNIIQNITGCSFGVADHDLFHVSPDLGPLRFNGGPTETMSPLTGSPAINAGNPAGCKNSAGDLLHVDQRGFPRPEPRRGRCDIGAVEVQFHHGF